VRHPALLVFEEAHNYLPRKPIEGRKTFARNAVEKVAKEGRKYGVAAMIISQRPSEISETVLSQCNSMILMRMNNPDDQEYAARVVSDQFRSLINLLPSMRPGEGFIIGDAVLMPMRTLIDMPPKLPQSANMDFFGLWANGGKGCDVDRIVQRWWRQERSAQALQQDMLEAAAPATSQHTAPLAQTPSFDKQQRKPGPTPAKPGIPRTPGAPTSKPPSPGDSGTADQKEKEKSAAQKKLAQLATMLGAAKRN
jgi:hypothetical protein